MKHDSEVQLSPATQSGLSPALAPLKELLMLKIAEAKQAEAKSIAIGDSDGMSYSDGRATAYACALEMLEAVSALSPQPPTSEHDDEVAMGLKQSRRLALILSDIRAIFDTNCVFTFDELPREVRKRIVGSPQPPSEARWQPIETAPKEDDQTVIVGFVETGQRKKPRRPYVGEAEYRNDVWWFLGDYVADNGCIDPQPTHWMPLPAPPRSPGETS